MADENNTDAKELKQLNENLSNIFECLYSISQSLKVFEVIVLNDSNYVSKNKKEINLNIDKRAFCVNEGKLNWILANLIKEIVIVDLK